MGQIFIQFLNVVVDHIPGIYRVLRVVEDDLIVAVRCYHQSFLGSVGSITLDRHEVLRDHDVFVVAYNLIRRGSSIYNDRLTGLLIQIPDRIGNRVFFLIEEGKTVGSGTVLIFYVDGNGVTAHDGEIALLIVDISLGVIQILAALGGKGVGMAANAGAGNGVCDIGDIAVGILDREVHIISTQDITGTPLGV